MDTFYQTRSCRRYILKDAAIHLLRLLSFISLLKIEKNKCTKGNQIQV